MAAAAAISAAALVPAASAAQAQQQMHVGPPKALFDREDKASYDTDVRALVVGYDDLSPLCTAALGVSGSGSDVQRVLCVGCGSGQELIALSRATRPAGAAPLTLVGVDPAAQMHVIAQQRLARELNDEQRARVELVHAYLHDVPRGDAKQYDAFDAATSVLVMHFLPADNGGKPGSKQAYLQSITERLRPGARLFLVDACGDTSTAAGLAQLHAVMDLWQLHGQAKGLSADVTAQKKKNFLNYHMVTPERVTALLEAAGFVDVTQLYRGFMFTGFRATYAGATKATTKAAALPPAPCPAK